MRSMVAGLPADLPASVLVVLHLPANSNSALPAILSRAGPLSARTALHGERLAHRQIYVAGPNHHLLVEDNTVKLSQEPAENGLRPSINVLFRSAAAACGASATGVLLSGTLDDGVAGLRAISARGGRTVVQDPADARYSDMPRRALRALTPDHVIPAAEIGRILSDITSQLAENITGVTSEVLPRQR